MREITRENKQKFRLYCLIVFYRKALLQLARSVENVTNDNYQTIWATIERKSEFATT